MEIGDSLHKKIEEVKPGEKGGGERDLEEVSKGEVDLRVPESEAVVETGRQMTEALEEGLLESEAVLAAGGSALVEVVPGAAVVVETGRQMTEALEEGLLKSEAVGVDGGGALVGVVPGAGDAWRQGGPVVEEVELKGRCEVRGGDKRASWGGGSLGNRQLLSWRASFQTEGMHGGDLLGLFGDCQQNEWCMVRSVAVPAQQGVARRQHDGSGLQRGFGEKFMEVLDEVDRESAWERRVAELGWEKGGNQDGGEYRRPGVLSGAIERLPRDF